MESRQTARGLAASLTAAIILCSAAASARGAQPGEAPQRGRTKAVIVEKGPPIDGVGEAGTWANCPALPLGDCTGVGPGPAKTTARVLFDATRLYVAWQCADSDTDSLARGAARRDSDVWQDDCVELFVTGDRREGYFHFIVNPRGVLHDARRTAASKQYDTSYNAGVEVKAAVRKPKGWSVTLAVPLKDLGAYVGKDQTWTVNLNRTRPARGGRPMGEWSWAIMGSNDYHQVTDYGRITGVTIPKRADGVTRTAAPSAPPPTYNEGVKAGSVTVYTRAADMEIRDTGGGLARTIDLKIRNSRGLKVAFVARGETPGGEVAAYGKTDSGAPVTWSVPFNMFDRRADDNTTSKAYRFLAPGRWQPMLYYCGRFRYNAIPNSTVANTTDYANIRFHGRAPGGKGTLALRDFCIYRGEDTTCPPAPTGLKAAADGKGVRLSWKRGTDNVGVAMYVISRAGKDGTFHKVGESGTPAYLDQPPPGKYRYRVLAVDFQNNLSAWSGVVSAEAAGSFLRAKPTFQASDRIGYAARVRRIHAAGAGKVVKGRVLCFGDSLTGATSYPRGVEAALGRYVVVGRGYASMRTSFGRKRIEQELAEVNPELCLILYGTNNSKAARAIPPAMEDLKAIAAACEKHGTVPVIGTIPPRGFKDPASQPEGRYNAALIATCRREKIPIAYCFEEFQASGDRRNLLAGDGVHTHNEGFNTFARAWAKTMHHVLFVLLDRPDGEKPAETPAPAGSSGEKTVSVPGLRWPPEGRAVKVDITRDNWTATVKDEKFGNNGGSSRLKLKGQQEHVLFDIDPAPLKGKIITGAVWHVRTASPKAPLLRVTVSSVAAPWVEGTASGYRRQEGSSCFVQAELGKRDWTYPGSTLMDAAFGKGHTIWRFAEASGPDENGWQSVAVDADVVAARVAGLSCGFGAYDDVGSIWSYRGGKFTYTYFPNRFIHSRESRGSAPWLEVWTSGTDGQAPGPVKDVAAETAGLPAGEALVTWTTPEDAGGGKTLGFHVRYAAGGKTGAIPRYLIPMAGKAGEKVRMHIHDLPFQSGQAIALGISAVDGAGNVGAVVTRSIRLSGSPRTFPIRPTQLKPFPPSKLLPAVGGLKVAVVDLVDKIHPKTGRMIPDQPAGYKGGNHIYSAAKKLVRLHAARNEAVCFQVNLEGKADRVNAALSFEPDAGLKATVSRFDYVATGAGPLGDVVLPLPAESFSVPFADDPQAAGARNVSLLCEVYVPHKTPAGRKAGKLTIRSGGEGLTIAVDLTVWDFTLPNKLSFVPEMNAYGTVTPTGNLAYYRLAHEHRLCMNRLYYPWRGTPSMAPKWTGEKLDFAQWDKSFAPLFDGSAFADLPRAREPVDVFYLHFNENWPADVYRAYLKNYWVDQAFRPDYKETLKKAFADMAAHCDKKEWHDTIFQFYLNNKVYYKRGGWRRSAAPWIFDEPVNTQDFWALRWYGVLWHQAVDPVRGKAKMWYRGDVSRTNYGRNMSWGVMDIECVGGANVQKVRMKHDEQVLWSRTCFTEYGSANDPAGANLQPVLWCLKAWSDGSIGVLPWQTIGSQGNLSKGSPTGLFIPHAGGIVPSVRLKCFRRGQQDTEYLTLLGDAHRQPLYAVAGGMRKMVDTHGEVHKTYEADAGTIRFDRTSPTALWRLRTSVGAMVSAKAPPYKRCVRPMPSPHTDMSRLPDIGYVRVAPKLPPSKPDMD